ncbi:YjjG family noncanonical pyrimidine nucleotidase [Janthinobacterium sp. PLB04]|uniref:YjjG family noncanonical pyrimidine nucleotidase n=1 Tax=Janthinobacterium lividum TaxID=29581 RepID=A0AAJ4MRK5_9BURK|nr:MULTISPECIES: YjjG family noncanonical pyrimidine nucleotidase [Janthinobacterium]KAB0326703.1 noncanonical pyrimidine nucleotidase, YjjG family [Janthinobacterium lividum]QSX95834.1 YjjG family noncanonical pyrimidine nucleotidase [Janthinobacterium lividum]UGQ35693.1 YjjG family noncanonical pyrimidine nucleotidase [Janthinobacterium sp. PLB04]
MKYKLFLFDLDDTLLDFRASEKRSFLHTMDQLGLHEGIDALFSQYQAINIDLWKRFETGDVSKDFLKVERFRKTFALNGIAIDPELASRLYLDSLPDTVVLIDGAKQVCETLSRIGEVGIITNGVESIQNRRIAASGLSDCISFVATSEACGHAKPDVRFFEYAANMARACSKDATIIIGDRLDADIFGANRYGIDSCWFNPDSMANTSTAIPTCEVASLHDIVPMLDMMQVKLKQA